MAERLFDEAYLIKQSVLGPNHRSTLATLGNLALVVRYRGDYKKAAELNERALALREEILPTTHPDIYTNLGNLAAVY